MKKGTSVEKHPLSDGYYWTINGDIFDFNNTIEEDITLYASKNQAYTVKVVISGKTTKKVENIQCAVNSQFDFTPYVETGLTMKIINEEGSVIKSLLVNKDCIINIIYL